MTKEQYLNLIKSDKQLQIRNVVGKWVNINWSSVNPHDDFEDYRFAEYEPKYRPIKCIREGRRFLGRTYKVFIECVDTGSYVSKLGLIHLYGVGLDKFNRLVFFGKVTYSGTTIHSQIFTPKHALKYLTDAETNTPVGILIS